MPYYIQKFYKPLNHFCHVSDVFTPEEVDKIMDLEDLQSFDTGRVGDGGLGREDPTQRQCDIMWINPDRYADWLFAKFANLTSQVNQDHFLYDIEMIENFQYTVYKNKNDHYSWHVDVMPNYHPMERKISASVLLSDPEEYEGGELDLIPNGSIENYMTFKPKKGDVVFFASWMPHRVRPVTKGIRKSLVAWVMGKRSL